MIEAVYICEICGQTFKTEKGPYSRKHLESKKHREALRRYKGSEVSWLPPEIGRFIDLISYLKKNKRLPRSGIIYKSTIMKIINEKVFNIAEPHRSFDVLYEWGIIKKITAKKIVFTDEIVDSAPEDLYRKVVLFAERKKSDAEFKNRLIEIMGVLSERIG